MDERLRKEVELALLNRLRSFVGKGLGAEAKAGMMEACVAVLADILDDPYAGRRRIGSFTCDSYECMRRGGRLHFEAAIPHFEETNQDVSCPRCGSCLTVRFRRYLDEEPEH